MRPGSIQAMGRTRRSGTRGRTSGSGETGAGDSRGRLTTQAASLYRGHGLGDHRDHRPATHQHRHPRRPPVFDLPLRGGRLRHGTARLRAADRAVRQESLDRRDRRGAAEPDPRVRGGRAMTTRPRTDWTTRIGLTVVAASAIATSFSALDGLARVAGWSSHVAFTLPLIVDTLGVIGTKVWLSGPTAVRPLARRVAVLAIICSVAGNIAYHLVAAGL